MVKKSLAALLMLALAWPAAAADAIPPVLKTFVPSEEWFLPTGTRLITTTNNAIFSYNLQTPVTAILDEDAKCPKNGRIVLPKGTQLIGVAEVLKTDDRVNIRFTLAVLPAPSGAEYQIQGLGLWPDGSAGLKGNVETYKQTDVRLMSSAASSTLLSVGQVVATSAGGGIAATAAGSAMQQGAHEVESAPSLQNKVDISVTVPPNQKCLVFLTSRLVLDTEGKAPAPAPRNKSEFNEIEYKGKTPPAAASKEK